jgi:acetyl-CoA carboxylase biotin carboxyl carrier protein
MTPRPSGEAGSAAGGSEHRRDNPGLVTADELSTVLDQVRHNTALLLSQLSHPPRVVRMRAGEVAIDIEWADAGTGPPEPIHGDQPAAANEGNARRLLTAQAVGVFYRAPEPGAEPFVGEGDLVVVGQQVAIIEAMKLMIPVEADFRGRVVEVLKGDGEPVEYGEPLFALVPAEPG